MGGEGLALAALLTIAQAGAAEPSPPPTLWHPRVYFAPGSTEVSPHSDEELARVAAVAVEKRFVELILSAHADSIGSAEENVKLSLRRAQAVADRLLALGMPSPMFITVKANGELRPSVAHGDDHAEQLNRVVHIDWR